MKKVIISVIATLLVLLFLVQMGWLEIIGIHPFPFFKDGGSDGKSQSESYDYATADNVRFRVKAEGNSFYFYQNGKWEKQFLKGVNIGAGEPGIFPGELSISYEDYYRWFTQISAMNANCIRAYTTLRPQFYNALKDFNDQAENPLYLFQGVWMDEADIQTYADVYAENGKIYNAFLQDAKNAVDVIHGNITLPERAGFASGVYTADVSKYFGGFIIGIEWDPKFVQNTNSSNPGDSAYDGEYLYTLSATPFEAFLCKVGDSVISYQTAKYQYQAPLAFSNWVTTDPVSHPNEPHPDEDLLTVNMENIKSRGAFLPNQFASYHVYPYYPDSLNYQEDYVSYIDEKGKANPYRAYLKDLKMAHTMPIMIAEFGVPTSRGMAHESMMGYHQGHIDETKVGDMLLDMFDSMYQEHYAGGLIFTWQDEWFKRTWNNVKFDVADKRPFWSNIQTNEQAFGVLAFDPGKTQSVCYVDGDVADWQGDVPIATGGSGELYMKSDERYVYFMAKLENYDFERDTLLIPLDTIDGQGNTGMNGTGAAFDREADFVLSIHGRDDSRILVDSYYDAFYYLYGEQYKMIPTVADIRSKNSGRFNPMLMCYGYEMTVPPANTVIPFKSYETGKLQFGVANPQSDSYESLADFIYQDGVLEVKIPWQLLNVMDPSGRQNMDDFYTVQNISPVDFTDFKVGFGVMKQGGGAPKITLNATFTYQGWTTPTYHERLKPSYYVLQEGLKAFE